MLIALRCTATQNSCFAHFHNFQKDEKHEKKAGNIPSLLSKFDLCLLRILAEGRIQPFPVDLSLLA